jgi:DNA-binding response OmpR family regulator
MSCLKCITISRCAKAWINIGIIADVISKIGIRCGGEGRKPNGVYSQFAQVIQPGNDLWQIANAIAIWICKRAGIDLINDAIAPPIILFVHAITLMRLEKEKDNERLIFRNYAIINYMAPSPSEKILVVESDPDVSDLVARQALTPMGYQVITVSDGSSAIRQAIQLQPDVLIVNLNLPGLSGKDLLVALTSQGMLTPMIVLAEKGQESHIIQAFRLGASDYLMLPIREAEVVSAVERALKQVRETRAREKLDAQIKQTNIELQRRVRELSTIFSVGRAVISITDQRVLFEKIVEAVTTVTEADFGWLTLKDDRSGAFVLAAHRNLPETWARKIGQPLDDGLGPLVAISVETLAIHGQALQKFKIAALGRSAMVVPVKVQNEAIGLLTVVRRSDRPFGESEHTLSAAISDYASISMVNARLFRALAQSAEAAQAGEKQKNLLLQNISQEMQTGLTTALYPVDLMLTEKMGALSFEQKQALASIQGAMKRLLARVSQQNNKLKP